MARGRIEAVAVVAAAVAVAGLVAGCGGGSGNPSVASLGGTTTSSVATGQAGSGPGPGSAKATADFAKFVHCMQQHGIQAQLGQGGHGVSISGGDPNSPQMQRAQSACSKLLPGGGPKALTPAQQAQQIKELVQLAKCMRKHGYPNFPDPDSQGAFDFTQANGIDPSSPQFQQAMTTCQPNGGKGHLRIGIRVGRPPSGGSANESIKSAG